MDSVIEKFASVKTPDNINVISVTQSANLSQTVRHKNSKDLENMLPLQE